MIRYIARRLLQATVIVAIVAAITFVLIHIAPGDPFSAVLDNPNVSERVRETLRSQYGLDRPLPSSSFATSARWPAASWVGHSRTIVRLERCLAAPCPTLCC